MSCRQSRSAELAHVTRKASTGKIESGPPVDALRVTYAGTRGMPDTGYSLACSTVSICTRSHVVRGNTDFCLCGTGVRKTATASKEMGNWPLVGFVLLSVLLVSFSCTISAAGLLSYV